MKLCFTSRIIVSASFLSIMYSSQASRSKSNDDSLVFEEINKLWVVMLVGFRSYAGDSRQPFLSKRNPWFLKWSSWLPMQMLNATRRYSSFNMALVSTIPVGPMMTSTISKYPCPVEALSPSLRLAKVKADAKCLRRPLSVRSKRRDSSV